MEEVQLGVFQEQLDVLVSFGQGGEWIFVMQCSCGHGGVWNGAHLFGESRLRSCSGETGYHSVLHAK